MTDPFHEMSLVTYLLCQAYLFGFFSGGGIITKIVSAWRGCKP